MWVWPRGPARGVRVDKDGCLGQKPAAACAREAAKRSLARDKAGLTPGPLARLSQWEREVRHPSRVL